MKPTDSTKKLVEEAERGIREFVNKNPITTTLGSFCIGVAVGAAEDHLHASEQIKRFGRQVFENHGQEFLERAFEGGLGSRLLRAGLTTLAERWAPSRSAQHRESSNPTSHRSKSFN